MNQGYSEIDVQTSYLDKVRQKLLLHTCYIIMAATVITFGQNIFDHKHVLWPYISGFLVSLILIILLKKGMHYRNAAIVFSLAGLVILSGALFFVQNNLHYTTPLYIVLHVLFTFFALGRFWGFILSLIHLVVFLSYLKFYSTFVETNL